MGSLEGRLVRLEELARGTTEDEKGRVSREALRRVTTEDLELVHAYLQRVVDEGGPDEKPTEEEEVAILRYEGIKEEVRNGY